MLLKITLVVISLLLITPVAANDGRMITSVFENSIEFMTTTAEFDVPQYKASLVMLPNILSPGIFQEIS